MERAAFHPARLLVDAALMPAKFPAPDGFRLVARDTVRAGEGTPVRVVHPDPGLRMTFAPVTPVSEGWYEFELTFPADGLVDVAAEFVFARGDVLWLRLPVVARNHFLAHFRLEDALKEFVLIVTGSGQLSKPARCRFARVGIASQLAAAVRRGVEIFRRDGFRVLRSGINYLWRLTRPGSIAISRGSAGAKGEAPYQTWIRIFDEAPERDAERHAERLATLARRPLISILASVASPERSERFARALVRQIYPAWELVIAAAGEQQNHIASAFAAAGLDVAKLRIVDGGANIAEGLNAALAVSQGEFILPLADSAVLSPHALLEFALTADTVASAQLVYADEDRIDANGRRSDWQFKPAWSPTWFQATNYLGSATLLRRAAVWELGGWRAGAPDPQHDLLLRLTAAAPRDVVHLAKILLHAVEPGEGAVRAHAASRAVAPPPLVSIIIPTRDGADVLSTCIRSIRSRTRYPAFEIIVVDNGSVQEETRRLFAELGNAPAIRIIPRPEPFNFSRLNNAAAREASGTVLAFVNNDIEVTQEGWLDEMVALAMRPDAGCVGAKLVYPDGRIQHAGVVVGLGGVAGHVHKLARGDDPGYLGRLRAAHEVSAVTAACLVIRRNIFEAVGGFDESLAVAFNDVDFCLKVRAAGYLNLWTPFAELIHHESVSRGSDLTPAKAKRFATEYEAMQRRWGMQLLQDPYYSPHLTYDREDSSLRLR
jgi:GT2 family glycosyltransferase